MAYDEGLAERVREALAGEPGIEEKAMFGGVGFLTGGNMICGVLRDDLIVRVGPDAHREALAAPHVREFDITGRSMRGWVMVAPEGYAEDDDLAGWVARGLAHARTLPPK